MTAIAIEATETLISVDSAAARLGVQAATVRRYVRSGRLAGVPGLGVWADSVEAYAARRDASVARTRACPGWRRPAPVAMAAVSVLPVRVTDVESAAAAWAEAGRLEALARKLKEQAGPVLREAGEGQHGRFHLAFTAGREVLDTVAVRADFAGRGAELPMRRNAPSIKVTPVA